jgi:hypothetical protein
MELLLELGKLPFPFELWWLLFSVEPCLRVEFLAELRAFLTVSMKRLPALPLYPLPLVEPLERESGRMTEPRKSIDFLRASSTRELSNEALVLI